MRVPDRRISETPVAGSRVDVIPVGRYDSEDPCSLADIRRDGASTLSPGCSMKPIFLSIALAVTLVLPATSLAQSSATPSIPRELNESASALIRPGDAVQITVWRKDELSGEFFVSTDGSIAHPFYQEVKIAGLSVHDATQRVQLFLEQYETSPRVRVDPIYRVSVAGEVRSPKLYHLRAEHTIYDAIDEAGGPTERGRRGRVRLYRDGGVFNLSIGGVNASAAEVRVQSGDRIVIERRIHVITDVIRPTVGFIGSVASITYAWRRLRR
jgi:protein involved in polysaccharide export with SLBB domain